MGEENGFSVQVDATGAGGTTAALVLRGELDAYAADRLTDAIDRIDPTAAGLDLDVAGLSFIDSSGLRVLLRAGERTVADATPTLRHAQPALLRLLDLTGLLDHFVLAP